MFEEMHKKRARRELRGKVVENSKIYCLNMKKNLQDFFYHHREFIALETTLIFSSYARLECFATCSNFQSVSVGMHCSISRIYAAIVWFFMLCLFTILAQLKMKSRLQIECALTTKRTILSLYFFLSKSRGKNHSHHVAQILSWFFGALPEQLSVEIKSKSIYLFNFLNIFRLSASLFVLGSEEEREKLMKSLDGQPPPTVRAARDRGDWEKCKQFFVRVLMWTIVCGKEIQIFWLLFFREIKNQFFSDLINKRENFSDTRIVDWLEMKWFFSLLLFFLWAFFEHLIIVESSSGIKMCVDDDFGCLRHRMLPSRITSELKSSRTKRSEMMMTRKRERSKRGKNGNFTHFNPRQCGVAVRWPGQTRRELCRLTQQ